MLFSRKPLTLPLAGEALPGRDEPILEGGTHLVLGTPLHPPFPDGFEQIVVGMGCFWGAERKFWQAPGVWTTAVGYAGGQTPNPTYEEACSGRTGHTEAVLAVFDPARTSLRGDAPDLLGGPRPDPGHGPRATTSARSTARRSTGRRRRSATPRSPRATPSRPSSAPPATARSRPRSPRPGAFYYAEAYHQQYLARNPNGYCGLGGTGVSCPVGLATV